MNVFVLGSTGYTGSSLISRLTSEKGISKVVALARNQEKARDLAARIEFSDKLEFVYGDFRYYDFDFGNIDAVIDLASVHNPYWGEQNPAEMIDINVGGIQRVVEAVRRFKVPYFIFASSQGVYDPEPSPRPFREDDILRPVGVKCVSKYASEVITRSLADSSTKFGMLRPSRIYGLGLNMRWDVLPSKFARLTCRGEDLPIYGDGNQTIDLVHVRDLCDCYYKLLVAPDEAWNDVYNVAGGRVVSISEFADIYIEIAMEMGLKTPGKSYLEKDVSNELPIRCLDITKAKERLGWTPSTSIEEGVKELIQAALDSHSSC